MTKQNPQKVKQVTWIGLVTNLFLAGFKGFVGIIGSSQAVIADAFHSISDVSTDIAILFGVKYWTAPPDENHPYGHRKIETMITMTIGIILAVVAISLGYKALIRIRQFDIKQPSWIAILGPFLSIILKEIIYRWTVNVGKREQSSALIANAWHHRSDALSSIPAVIAVGVATLFPNWAFVDSVGALIVSVFILKISWDITKPTLLELTDGGVSIREQQDIQSIVMSIDSVLSVHAIRTRKFGSGIYVDLHIQVEPEMSVRKGHHISEVVKQILLKKGPNISDVVVHLEPFESGS